MLDLVINYIMARDYDSLVLLSRCLSKVPRTFHLDLLDLLLAYVCGVGHKSVVRAPIY